MAGYAIRNTNACRWTLRSFCRWQRGTKTAVGFFIFAIRPPDDFPLLKIRSCFTFNDRGNSLQNYSLIGNLRKISAKDFILLPRCYLPPFSIISRNIRTLVFMFHFNRLWNAIKILNPLCDKEKAGKFLSTCRFLLDNATAIRHFLKKPNVLWFHGVSFIKPSINNGVWYYEFLALIDWIYIIGFSRTVLFLWQFKMFDSHIFNMLFIFNRLYSIWNS